MGIKDFIKTIGIAGAVAGGIDGILIVLMFHKAKKLGDRKPEYIVKPNLIISVLLIIVFVIGIIYSTLESFGIIGF